MPNYFAPSFQIEVNGSRLHADVSNHVQTVQVVSTPDSLDQFSFTLANPLPKMPWTNEYAELFKLGNAVTIMLGYVGDLRDMMEGEITQVTPTYPASGVPTVTIAGHSLMHRLSGGNITQTFQNTTPKQIAEKIAQQTNLAVQADDVPVQMEYVIQPNQSHLAFLKGLARGLHFEILVRNKTLIFRKTQEAAPKVLTLIWFGPQESFAPPPDTMPLKSFSPQMNGLAPATSVQTRSWDSQNKKAIVSNATSANQTSLMGGQQRGGDASMAAYNQPRCVVHVNRPCASQQENDQDASSTYNAKALQFIEGTAETIGIPELWSGQVVELKGLGPTFTGCYLVDEATHTLDENGYNTSIKVKRSAS